MDGDRMDVRDRYLCAAGREWHRVGYPTSDNYSWIELRPRPLSDGHHESGYRFLSLTGAWTDDKGGTVLFDDDDGVRREDLNQWADHAMFYGVTNIDVELDGTIRIMCWGKNNWDHDGDFWSSSAMFYPQDLDSTIELLKTYKKIRSDD